MPRESSATYRITDLIESERPRERLARLGAQSLSDAELLAIMLRVGVQGENAVEVGTRLLKKLGGLEGLQRAEFTELCDQKGLGIAKASQIKAAIEIGRRISTLKPEDKGSIHSPADAAALVQYEMSALEREELWLILLDVRNRILNLDKTYKGSLTSSQIRVAELFKIALRCNAHGFIIVHNHPSGDPTPSPEDVAITRAIVQAGKLMDVDVLDHLVIGRGRFVSLKERGLGFGS